MPDLFSYTLMDLEFFEMTYEDLDEVLAIEKACFRTPWTKAMFVSELNNKGTTYIYVVRSKDKSNRAILGYVVFWHLLVEVQIANIATHPDYLRKGIGEGMIKFTFKKVVEMGVREVFLEVRVSNMPAMNLYEKLGFEKYGIRKKYYSDSGEDAILMRKLL